MLTLEIDIRSEKLKLTKFLSEYDLQYIPEDLKNHPYLTLYEFASHKDRLEGIPYSIIEDDLPKIKPRHFSIVNDPFSDKEKSNQFKICFTVHRFGDKKEGFCTSFLKEALSNPEKRIKVQFSHSNKVISLD